MLGSEILDVAIGMIFVYLLLSLICSAVNEVIEAWLKKRATDLERGIRELLNDPNGTGLVNKLYDHYLVNGLFRGAYTPGQIKKGRYRNGSNLPSYIPARNFALALMDIVLPATTNVASGATGATPPNIAAAVNVPPPHPDPVAVDAPLQPLRKAIGDLGNQGVEKALMTLVDAAGNDASKARENIEAWYNSAMDRVAGLYKRRAQWIILGLGLGAAIALNADSTYIARSLLNDPTLRNSLVAAAQEYAKQPVSGGNTKPEDKIKNNVKTIQGLGLPIGWSVEGNDPYRQWPGLPWKAPSLQDWIWAWLYLFYWHMVGWLLTAFAISQGAPFWFDLLNKFIVIRSTVKPHEKSPEEGSKE